MDLNLSMQIEYLVVAFDDRNQKVRLSLRQADILEALAKDESLSHQGGCVPEIQHIERYNPLQWTEYVSSHIETITEQATNSPFFTLNSAASCLSRRLALHGELDSRIF